MNFDEILTPGIPEEGIKRLKNDLIYIYHYSILQSKENNLHLLENLDIALLKSPLEQSQSMSDFTDAIRELMKKKPAGSGKSKDKEEIYL